MSDTLVPVTLIDNSSRTQIQYYADCTLNDLAEYLDQQAAKPIGTYCFCSDSTDTVFPLNTSIGNILSTETSISFKLMDNTPMTITARFKEYDDATFHFRPDDLIRNIREILSKSFDMPPSSFRIRFGDQDCNPDDLIYNAGIRDGSVIDVEITEQQQISNAIHVTFRSPMATLQLELAPDATFQAIQEQLITELGLVDHEATVLNETLDAVPAMYTIQQYLDEHKELNPPYSFNIAIQLKGGIVA